MAGAYVPRRGDVIWMQFNPKIGHEQAGRRPALIISPEIYNSRVGLTLLCPITTRIKNYPFEVPLPSHIPVYGVILADQVKSLDWRIRRASFVAQVPDSVLLEVLSKIKLLLN